MVGYISQHVSRLYFNSKFIDIYSYHSSQVTVLLGNGNGTFGMPINFSIEYLLDSSQMVAIDTDQDHILDLAIIDRENDYITFILGNGDGSFREGTRIIGCSSYLHMISVGDFNDDMIMDIALLCYADGYVSIYLGDGDGSFPTKIRLYTENGQPVTIAIGDFNGDNHSDVAISHTITRTMGVFIGYGNGSFEKQKKSFSGGGYNANYMIFSDFNADGKQDMIVSYEVRNFFKVFLGHGDGTFSEKARFSFGLSGISGEVTKDFNRDGYLDIATVINSPYSVVIFFGDGDGQFQNYTISFKEDSHRTYSISAGDFNDDGYEDIIITHSNSYSFDIFLNTGQCNFNTNISIP